MTARTRIDNLLALEPLLDQLLAELRVAEAPTDRSTTGAR